MRPYRLQNKYINDIADEMTGGNSRNAAWRSVLPAYAERYVVPEDRGNYISENIRKYGSAYGAVGDNCRRHIAQDPGKFCVNDTV